MINYELLFNNDIIMTSSLTLNRPVAIMGGICDGPISDYVYHVIVYQCTKFGGFIMKFKMVLLCRPTSVGGPSIHTRIA